jgi:nicotinamidase-related amidase
MYIAISYFALRLFIMVGFSARNTGVQGEMRRFSLQHSSVWPDLSAAIRAQTAASVIVDFEPCYLDRVHAADSLTGSLVDFLSAQAPLIGPVIFTSMEDDVPAEILAGAKHDPIPFPQRGGGKPSALVYKPDLSGFKGTGLNTFLKKNGIDTLVMGGLFTHDCVYETLWDALRLGYKVALVSDLLHGEKDFCDPCDISRHKIIKYDLCEVPLIVNRRGLSAIIHEARQAAPVASATAPAL